MIVNHGRTFGISIPPGQTLPINISGSFFRVLTNSIATNLVVSFDNGASSEFSEGYGEPTVKWSKDQVTLVPAVFSSIQLHNPSPNEVMVLRLSVSMATPMDSRIFLKGTVQIDAAGVPEPAGMLEANTVAGLSVILGKYTREVIFDVDATSAVIVYKDGKRMARLKADSMNVLTVRNCTLIVKGDGASAYVAITPIEGV